MSPATIARKRSTRRPVPAVVVRRARVTPVRILYDCTDARRAFVRCCIAALEFRPSALVLLARFVESLPVLQRASVAPATSTTSTTRSTTARITADGISLRTRVKPGIRYEASGGGARASGRGLAAGVA
eukprot:771318-Rhodomonas_salina.1